jgi:hypothetical protein
VASPETALLDARDFPSPVVTPLELEVALGARPWGGGYSTDFADLLRDAPGSNPGAAAGDAPGGHAAGQGAGKAGTKPLAASASAAAEAGFVFRDDPDAPAFSLVTSKLQDSRRGRPPPPEKVALAFEGSSSGGFGGGTSRALATYHSPAAEFLASRSYQVLPH